MILPRYRKQLPKEFAETRGEFASEEGGPRWTPAPRETEADDANDRRSLRRKLDHRLFFMVRPKGSADAGWEFPVAEPQEVREATREGGGSGGD